MRRITVLFLLLTSAVAGAYAQAVSQAPPSKPYESVVATIDNYFEAAHYGAWDFAIDLGQACTKLQDELDGNTGVNPKTLLAVVKATIELRERAELFSTLADALDNTVKAVKGIDGYVWDYYDGKGAKLKDELGTLRDGAAAVEPIIHKRPRLRTCAAFLCTG